MIDLRSIKDKITTRLIRSRVWNNLNKIVGGEVILEIEEYEGIFKMDTRSHIFKRIVAENSFEPESASLVKRFTSNKDYIDVGANVGLFTILFSKLSSSFENKILAIEPNPNALSYLKFNVAMNVAKQNVIIYEGIATDSKGTFDLNFIDGLSEYSSANNIVHPVVTNKIKTKQKVQGSSLDQLVVDFNLEPGFIKIDVEGGEQSVLKGAVGTIKNFQPVILLEINDFESLKDGISSFYKQFFNELDYQILNLSLKKAKAPYVGEYICLPNRFVFPN